MEDQAKFLEALQEVKEIAKSQQNHLTRQEVEQYLSDMDLSGEKMNAVYRYLAENKISVEGVAAEPEDAADMEQPVILQHTKEQPVGLVSRFLAGDDSVRDQIIEYYLREVTAIAAEYKKTSVLQEDVMAEGNLGLLTGMEVIRENREQYKKKDGTPDCMLFLETLREEIKHAIVCYIDGETEAEDWEHTVVAKTNLLYEAKKYMAEEIGRVPTVDELSEYTKIGREEIFDIMRLSEDL
ncbi:MAG: hypothetical protein LUH14_01835 [Clostridiaceae bacterium]|nr:hypothetical protein [Clostridiaceae bacterium]